jgi:hypothetical protein
MTKQLMIYEQVVPISLSRHKELCVQSGIPYDFARELRAVPLVAEEIPFAAREYTVVFAVTDKEGSVSPFVILGVKDKQNLYVSSEGEWTAKYIPAFIRRYPFVFSTGDGGKTFTLCIDETWQGCNQEGRGERLFTDAGERTPFVDRLLKFNEEYQRSAQRTALFSKKLQELNLLDSKQAKLTLGTGEELTLTGFMVVDRAKLTELAPESLSELAKNGILDLIYAHLLSMGNLASVAERLAGRSPVEPAAQPASTTSEPSSASDTGEMA